MWHAVYLFTNNSHTYRSIGSNKYKSQVKITYNGVVKHKKYWLKSLGFECSQVSQLAQNHTLVWRGCHFLHFVVGHDTAV